MIESIIVLFLVVIFRATAIEYADKYTVLKSLILWLNIGLGVAALVTVIFIGITIAAKVSGISSNRR